MPRLRLGTPLWLGTHSNTRVDRFPALRGAHTVDIAIIGGGFTGATIAWHFAASGIRVALVEADRVGRGSTAASTALLMQEPDEDLVALGRRYGRRRALRVWQLNRDAIRDAIRTISSIDIACDLSQSDSIYYALSEAAARKLRREYRSRVSAGLSCRWLDAQAVEHKTGFAGAAAIQVTGNAQLNPLKACRGFIRAAVESGADVFERSPVIRIDPARDHVTISTSRGRIDADYVIVATGYATPYFRPLAGRFQLLTTYVAATRPLAEAERRAVGLDGVMVWDTERPYHYARWTGDDRLIIGGCDRPFVSEEVRRRTIRAGVDEVRDYFVGRYPALGDVALDYAWDGLFAMTPDGLPYIGPHRRYRRHLFALGYGGNGMTLGFLAGSLLLDWYRGRNPRDLDLFAFSRGRE
jgi:glycine/D-amino acid oxidase-like deaminating enzyme